MTRLAYFSLIALVLCFVTIRAAAKTTVSSEIRLALFLQEADTTQADTTQAEKKKDLPLPLEPERALTFTTDEGSWLSLDVSPDGQTIVFELLGDLYTVPLTGGAATPLTSGMAFDTQPRYSPDGARLLFISDRSGSNNLWMIDFAEEDTVQLTKGKTTRYESPEWAPDGKYIVVSKSDGRFGPTKLWMMHVDGGSGTGLIKEPQSLRTLGAAFTPDGRHIWFARRTGTWQYNAIFPQYQLAVYDRETGETYTRTSRYGSAFRPTLSPDGQWLVYGTRYEAETGLRLRDLATGQEHWLAYPVQRDDQESVASRDVLPGMSFTPDSEELVVSYGGKIWRLPIDGGDAIPVPFTVEVDLEIGPELAFNYSVDDTPTFTVREIRDAVPSPDGAQLAFTALDQLYVMDYLNGTPRRLTEAEMVEAQPTWSPDGQWIAFVTWSDDDGGHLYKVRANGQGQPQQLSTTSAIYQQPAWSPDGQRVAAIRGPARAYEESTGPIAPGAVDDLVWIAADGGAATVIAPAEGRSRPHFTEDPDRVYLFHNQKGLLSVRWDGTDEKAHVKVTGNTRPGATQPNRASIIKMAPRGDQALAQVNSDLYVVTVPYVGGDTPSISVNNPENAAFPARKLTDIGGQFPAWSADGRAVHWSIGNAHVVYSLDDAEAFADSVKAAQKAAEESEDEEGEDDEEEGEYEPDEDTKKEYEPVEMRIRVEATRDLPQATAVLRGVRLITMNGDEVIEGGEILIQNNRIAGVGARGSLTVPDDAQVIDVTGKTIVPGFIDTHAHMRPAWGVHKPQAWSYHANLAYGVTTTRDPQTATSDVLTYSDRVRAGTITGPRIYSTGRGIFGDLAEDPIRDLDHARDILKRYSDYYDTKTVKMYMSGNRQQRQWILIASKEQGLMPTTEGGLDLKYNLTMMIDGYPGQEHSLPVFPLYEDVVRLAAETKIAYSPTLLVSYGGPFGENYFYTRENPHDDPKLRRFTPHQEIDRKTRRRGAGTGPGPGGWFMDEEHVFQKHAEVANRIVEAGGRVGVGSHGQLQGLGYHWELWAVASGGMSNHDALRCATIFGADAIGLGQELGTLSAGKLADLVVLDANPLDDIRNTNTVHYVMMNGRLYDGDTLDEVYPRQRPMEALSWQGHDPGVVPGLPGQ